MTGPEAFVPYLVASAIGWALRHWGIVGPNKPLPPPAPLPPSPPILPNNPMLDELLKRLMDLFKVEQERAQAEATQRVIEKLAVK